MVTYVINSYLKSELGWSSAYTFEQGMKETIEWYLSNEDWMNNVLSGEYAAYYNKMYGCK